MDQFVQIMPQCVLDGLILGFVYAMVALGYTMVYGVIRLINFAHSEIFMIGAFAGTEVLLFLQAKAVLASIGAPIALLLALIIALLFSGGVGVIAERIAYRPLRKAPRLVLFISTIGISFFLQDAVRLIAGLKHNAFYLATPSLFTSSLSLLPNLSLPVKSLIVILTSLVMMVLLQLFVSKSKWGKAMRAVAQDKSTAALMGINVDKVISLTFFIGAGLGGVAGILFALQYTMIHPYIGFILGMKAFTAAVLGGIGNIPGAMLGGILLGLLESLGATSLGTLTSGAMGAEYKDVFAFAILIIVLIFKPAGLLGRRESEKI